MAHLHQVIDLDAAAEARLADGGPVDRSVSLHFNVVFDNHGPRRHDLVVRAVRLPGESEAVGPDYRAVLQDDVVPDAHVFTHDGMGVGQKAVANLRAAVNHHKTLEHAIVSQDCSFLNHHVGADGGIAPELGVRGDDGGRMDAGGGTRGGPKQLQGLGERQVRVLRAQQGPAGRLDVWRDDNRGGARALEFTAVFGIREERQLALASLVHSRDTCNIEIACAFQSTAEAGCKVIQLHKFPLF